MMFLRRFKFFQCSGLIPFHNEFSNFFSNICFLIFHWFLLAVYFVNILIYSRYFMEDIIVYLSVMEHSLHISLITVTYITTKKRQKVLRNNLQYWQNDRNLIFIPKYWFLISFISYFVFITGEILCHLLLDEEFSLSFFINFVNIYISKSTVQVMVYFIQLQAISIVEAYILFESEATKIVKKLLIMEDTPRYQLRMKLLPLIKKYRQLYKLSHNFQFIFGWQLLFIITEIFTGILAVSLFQILNGRNMSTTSLVFSIIQNILTTVGKKKSTKDLTHKLLL